MCGRELDGVGSRGAGELDGVGAERFVLRAVLAYFNLLHFPVFLQPSMLPSAPRTFLIISQ